MNDKARVLRREEVLTRQLNRDATLIIFGFVCGQEQEGLQEDEGGEGGEAKEERRKRRRNPKSGHDGAMKFLRKKKYPSAISGFKLFVFSRLGTPAESLKASAGWRLPGKLSRYGPGITHARGF